MREPPVPPPGSRTVGPRSTVPGPALTRAPLTSRTVRSRVPRPASAAGQGAVPPGPAVPRSAACGPREAVPGPAVPRPGRAPAVLAARGAGEAAAAGANAPAIATAAHAAAATLLILIAVPLSAG